MLGKNQNILILHLITYFLNLQAELIPFLSFYILLLACSVWRIFQPLEECNQCVNRDVEVIIISVMKSRLPVISWSAMVFRKNLCREQYCMECGEVTLSLKYNFSSDLLLVCLLGTADSQLSCSTTAIFFNSSIDTWQKPHSDLMLFIKEQFQFFHSKSALGEQGAFLLWL